MAPGENEDIASAADAASNSRNSNEETPLIQRRMEDVPDGGSGEYIQYYSDGISVRVLRFILYLLFLVCFVWTVLLTVNVFTSIKPFIVPGSGFLELDLSLLALVRVFIGLKFFASATRSDLYFSYLSSLLLFLDGILLVSVPHLRHKHGGTVVGIITIVGTLVVFLVCSGCVAMVLRLYARARDEEASIVNPEGHHQRRKISKKTRLKNFFTSSMSFSGCLALLVLIVLFSGFLALNSVKGSMDPPRPGHLVPVNNNRYNIHIACTPEKDTLDPESKNLTVLMETDTDTPSEEFASWALKIAQDNKNVNRVCYYDRPGLGWSDSAPSPQSISTTLHTLWQALDHEGISHNSTFMLLAHGVGGLYSRSFAASIPNNLHGLVLIDTPDEDLFLAKITPLKGLLYFVKGMISPISRGGYYKVKLQQHLARGLIQREIKAANTMLNPDAPLTVVSSAQSITKIKKWGEGQRRLTKLSNNTISWTVLEGPHELWKDQDSKARLQSLLHSLLTL